MGSADFVSGWDTTILMLPFLGILALYLFRLDERFAAPKTSSTSRRFFCELDPQGRAHLSDPDGQAWRTHGGGQIEARVEPAAHSAGHDFI
jgi:hypothetical protein